MESSTWCTRRLGGSVAALSEESSTVAKFRPTSCCLSINATPVDGRSSGASCVPGTTCYCPPTPVTSVTDTDSVLRHCHCSPDRDRDPRHHYHHDHDHDHDYDYDYDHAGRIVSLCSSNRRRHLACCDLCERLRGRSCEEGERGREPKEERRPELRRGTARRQQRHVPPAEHAARVTSPRISRRDGPMSHDSSSSYVASVVRWSGHRLLESSFRWTRQKRASAWTILFLLVLVFPASADLQKQTASRDPTKDEGGE
ncbi:hypothetical protein K0M31_017321 [Melipona bicolor]|uniref:Uncharacterized protein n=1 Tax=Melipona bicolor TaxID=60889 RepID=A0AA40G559_9HYME|nr:hypothetical protein K0M31_017321 [Melipona bicolor]